MAFLTALALLLICGFSAAARTSDSFSPSRIANPNVDGDSDNFDSDDDFGNTPRIVAWPDGVVPYTISSDVSDADSKKLKDELDYLSRKTCVRFVPRRSEANYTLFRGGDKCSAPLGVSQSPVQDRGGSSSGLFPSSSDRRDSGTSSSGRRDSFGSTSGTGSRNLGGRFKRQNNRDSFGSNSGRDTFSSGSDRERLGITGTGGRNTFDSGSGSGRDTRFGSTGTSGRDTFDSGSSRDRLGSGSNTGRDSSFGSGSNTGRDSSFGSGSNSGRDSSFGSGSNTGRDSSFGSGSNSGRDRFGDTIGSSSGSRDRFGSSGDTGFGTGSRSSGVSGASQVVLAKSCFQTKRLARRLLNLLGIPHEASRPDRDQYVTINFDNIRTGYTKNLKQIPASAYLPGVLDLPYDYESVSQYADSDVARNKNTWAIKPKNSRSASKLGGEDFSRADIDKINKAYRCRN